MFGQSTAVHVKQQPATGAGVSECSQASCDMRACAMQCHMHGQY